MAQGRISALDGLRGLAACGVAFFVHFFHVGGIRETGPAFEIFAWVYRHGETLVDLFFVLSGFVICHACSRLDTRTFVVHRFARLYPLHLATFAVAAVLLLVGGAMFGGLALEYETDLGRAALNLSLLHGILIFDNRFGFNPPSWSISAEAACYLLFALVVRSKRPIAWAACLILMALVAPMTGWLARALIGFFVGFILRKEILRLARIPSWLLACAGILAISLMSVAPNDMVFIVAGLWAWPAIVLLALKPPFDRVLSHQWLEWLGDRSYGIYMIHTPVHLALLLCNGGRYFDRSEWPLLFVVSAGATLGLADLSFRYLEGPSRRAIRRALAPEKAHRTTLHVPSAGGEAALVADR